MACYRHVYRFPYAPNYALTFALNKFKSATAHTHTKNASDVHIFEVACISLCSQVYLRYIYIDIVYTYKYTNIPHRMANSKSSIEQAQNSRSLRARGSEAMERARDMLFERAHTRAFHSTFRGTTGLTVCARVWRVFVSVCMHEGCVRTGENSPHIHAHTYMRNIAFGLCCCCVYV